MTATEIAAVAAATKTAVAAMATAVAIATMAMAMVTAMTADVQLLVRGVQGCRALGGGDDLGPLFWFLRSAHFALFLSLGAFPSTDRIRPL